VDAGSRPPWMSALCACALGSLLALADGTDCSILRPGARGLGASRDRGCALRWWMQLRTEVHPRAGGGINRWVLDLPSKMLLSSD